MKVELEIGVNTLSPNYCRSKGEQIALNVDGTGYDEGNTYSTYVRWLSVSLLFLSNLSDQQFLQEITLSSLNIKL